MPSDFSTFTGRRMDLLRPKPGDFSFTDIAQGLSNTCRFSGQVSRFHSVAQHSVNVANVLTASGLNAEMALAGLLHDASEAYIADVPAPLKEAECMIGYRSVEANLMIAIYQWAGIDVTLIDHPMIKSADVIVRSAEARELFTPPPAWAMTVPDLRHAIDLRPMPPNEAAIAFVSKWKELEQAR